MKDTIRIRTNSSVNSAITAQVMSGKQDLRKTLTRKLIESSSRTTCSIDKFSEEKLLIKLRSIIQGMSDFTSNTRSVHKELKDGTHELVRVFNYYSAKWREEMKTSASKGKKNAIRA